MQCRLVQASVRMRLLHLVPPLSVERHTLLCRKAVITLFHLCAPSLADKWLWTYQHFVRDVPGSFDVWMEVCAAQSALPTSCMSCGACLRTAVAQAQSAGVVHPGMSPGVQASTCKCNHMLSSPCCRTSQTSPTPASLTLWCPQIGEPFSSQGLQQQHAGRRRDAGCLHWQPVICYSASAHTASPEQRIERPPLHALQLCCRHNPCHLPTAVSPPATRVSE